VLASRPDLPSLTTKINILWDRWNFAFRVQKVAPHTCNKMHGSLTQFCGILALNNTQAHAQKGDSITGEFYVYGSVHRWTILITVQRDATQSSLFIILQVHYTCFGCQPHPSSGVHKTVTTAFGTGHIFCAATSLQRGQAWPRWREVAAQKHITSTGGCSYSFVYSGCGWHPKHVEWTCRIINRLLCVASRWAVINIITGDYQSIKPTNKIY